MDEPIFLIVAKTERQARVFAAERLALPVDHGGNGRWVFVSSIESCIGFPHHRCIVLKIENWWQSDLFRDRQRKSEFTHYCRSRGWLVLEHVE